MYKDEEIGSGVKSFFKRNSGAKDLYKKVNKIFDTYSENIGDLIFVELPKLFLKFEKLANANPIFSPAYAQIMQQSLEARFLGLIDENTGLDARVNDLVSKYNKLLQTGDNVNSTNADASAASIPTSQSGAEMNANESENIIALEVPSAVKNSEIFKDSNKPETTQQQENQDDKPTELFDINTTITMEMIRGFNGLSPRNIALAAEPINSIVNMFNLLDVYVEESVSIIIAVKNWLVTLVQTKQTSGTSKAETAINGLLMISNMILDIVTNIGEMKTKYHHARASVINLIMEAGTWDIYQTLITIDCNIISKGRTTLLNIRDSLLSFYMMIQRNFNILKKTETNESLMAKKMTN